MTNELTSLETDNRKVGALRLALASAALLAHLLDTEKAPSSASLLALISYWLYSCLLLGLAFTDKAPAMGRWPVWGDLVWYALLLILAAPHLNIPVLFLLFPILVASFTLGCAEGRRLTLAAVLIYISIAFTHYLGATVFDWSHVFLRSVFLVGLGLLIAHWGGAEIDLKRQLNLLREVGVLSNPRFGADHTTMMVMEKIRKFYSADVCVVVYYCPENESYWLRHTNEHDAPIKAQPLTQGLAQSLLSYGEKTISVCTRGFLKRERSCVLMNMAGQKLGIEDEEEIAGKAAFLDTEYFISAPLPLLRTRGRIYVGSNTHRYSRDAVLFLGRVAKQAFFMIEQIELLDRIATQAGEEERKKISGDLHDNTLQPYIGLKLGLDALLQKADTGWPLRAELEQLSAMAQQVISDLRSYVQRVRTCEAGQGNALLDILHKQSAKFNDYYGIDVRIEAQHIPPVSDRMAAAILQFIIEGLTNIRKHTNCTTAKVHLGVGGGHMRVIIENAWDGIKSGFTPRSILERAQALGGNACVDQKENCTRVCITIPL